MNQLYNSKTLYYESMWTVQYEQDKKLFEQVASQTSSFVHLSAHPRISEALASR